MSGCCGRHGQLSLELLGGLVVVLWFHELFPTSVELPPLPSFVGSVCSSRSVFVQVVFVVVVVGCVCGGLWRLVGGVVSFASVFGSVLLSSFPAAHFGCRCLDYFVAMGCGLRGCLVHKRLYT